MTAKANMHSNNSCFSSIGVKDLEKKAEKMGVQQRFEEETAKVESVCKKIQFFRSLWNIG